ncbi:Uncharacterized protein Fot_40423 [Forsythia ovata]|uniref:Acetyl-CoA carboxylase beta subunit n=1 Tax=Forsythia ovata TaxID=205694 RepID=A0ABD1S883_9LAMI
MKSFEEEVMGSPSPTVDVVDLKSASEEESHPDLGYFLEASNDELGLSPSSSSPAGALCEGKAELGRVDSDSSKLGGELWGNNYDSFESKNSFFDMSGNGEGGCCDLCVSKCCRFIITSCFTALYLWLALRTSKPTCSIQDFYVPILNKTRYSSLMLRKNRLLRWMWKFSITPQEFNVSENIWIATRRISYQ